MGEDWVHHNNNPLDPENLIHAWLAAIHVMQLQPKGNLAMYGLFDSKVLYVLPRMYEKIGHYLEEITPKKSKSGKKKSDRQNKTKDLDLDQFDNLPKSSDGSSSRNAPSDDFDSDDDPIPELRTDELVSLLDKLQRNRDLDDSDFYNSSYLLDLRGILNAHDAVPEGKISPWTIGQINDDVVDMTELLFSFIMEDINLPEDIRFHIARLQIPYLKLGFQYNLMII